MIVDSQIHIWRGGPLPPPDGREAEHRRITAEETLAEMDRAGVDRAVLVPHRWDGLRNDLAIEAVKRHPTRFAIIGRLSIEKPRSRTTMAKWKAQPGMLGLRANFKISPSEWMTDGTCDWLWESAQDFGIVVSIHAPGLSEQMHRLAAKYRGLKLVIDHMGLSGHTLGPAAFSSIDELVGLARNPNIAVKVSALPCYADDPYPFRKLHPFVRRIVEAFGPERSFWGSDLSRLPCPYRQCVTAFTEEMDWLSKADLEQIMGKALGAWVGWPATGSA